MAATVSRAVAVAMASRAAAAGELILFPVLLGAQRKAKKNESAREKLKNNDSNPLFFLFPANLRRCFPFFLSSLLFFARNSYYGGSGGGYYQGGGGGG